MEKRVLQTYAVWARDNLEQQIEVSLKTLGINGDNDFREAKQSGDFTYIEGDPNSYPASLYGKRREIISEVRLKGYQNIIEEVAYTWFNRLVALRFMELHNYLSHGFRVLSSTSGSIEPDILKNLSLAKTDLRLDMKICEQLKSQNKTEELFRHVLICQCGALSDVLPRLFSRDSGYMELLLPKSLLIGETVLTRLVKIPEENFMNDVQIIGWLYQYYNTKEKEKVFASLKKNIKISKEDIPAATQLFTPDWIVRYMVENSLGRLWLEGHPNDALKAQWKYYLDEAEQEPEVQAQLEQIRAEYRSLKPEEIKVIDPCMGSGHILVYIFDVLMQIYESQGYTQRDAAQNIVRHNLHGLDIDKRAAQLAYFAVMMKARQYDRRFFSSKLQPMVYSTTGDEDGENFGSLLTVDDPGEMPEDPQSVFDQADYERRLNVWNYRYLLAQKYHVVVTNPPYMGGAGMSGKLAEFVKKNYPDSKSDLSTAFMEQTLRMCNEHGYMSMINIPVWMFLSSYEKLREKMIKSNTFISMVHPGRGIFGSDFGTTTFVIEKTYISGYAGSYRRLFEKQGEVEGIEEREQAFLAGKGSFTAQQDNFSKIPSAPAAYWVSEKFIEAYSNKKIGEYGFARSGLQTGNNDLFLKYWHEVHIDCIAFGMRTKEDYLQTGKKWTPQIKGGEFRKWYGNFDYIVNWKNDGAEIRQCAGCRLNAMGNDDLFFKSGITWSHTTSSVFGARYLQGGCLFNVEAPTLFLNASSYFYFLGFLNSCVAQKYLTTLNSTMHYLVGNIVALPICIKEDNISIIDKLVERSISLSRTDWDSFETSWDFKRHPLVRGVSTVLEAFAAWEAECEGRFQQLKANEEELNRIFIDIYGLQDELTPEVEDKDMTVRRADLGRDVRSLLSYAVGCMFGRYSLDVDGLAYAGGEWDASKYSTFLPDADGILPITDEDYLEDDIVTLLCVWLKKVYGPDTLEENLDFIAKALGNKGATSREVIRNYFLKDFFADHCKIFQKRPIYWLFDSGKQNGFKALIYLHRYTPDTIGNVRIDYLHRMQRVYENEIDRMQDMIEHSKNPREVAASAKRKEKLQKQLKECREYDEKISHLALSRIELDLDDGVKVNYRKMQTASDSKFYEVLADSKNIMGKK